MKTILASLCLSLCLSISLGDELAGGCAALTACMEDVQSQYDECTRQAADVDMSLLDAIIPEHKREKLECMKVVKEARDEKSALNRERETAYRACLAERASLAKPSQGRKAERCASLVEAFAAERGRVKRATGRSQRRAEKRKRRLEREEALEESGLSLRQWRELKQQRKAFKTCKRDANRLRKRCKPLTKCCSESQICHLDYELSETHDGIKAATKAIILQKRKCSKGKAFDEIADEEVSADQILQNQLPGSDD